MYVFLLAALGVATIQRAEVTPLQTRVVSATPLSMDHVIIGRGWCGRSTWLLTDAPSLIEVKIATLANVAEWSTTTVPVHGFSRDERPWGLACVGNRQLWTLVGYRTLAQLSTSGAVIARMPLRQPYLNVFGFADVLLLQRPPAAAGAPLLLSARAADISRAQPWPGLAAPPQAVKKTDVASGLVACGVGTGSSLPCWVATDTRIVVSDGAPERTSVIKPEFLTNTAVDSTTPLWDAAVTSSSVVWILTSAVGAEAGRRVGARLAKSNLRGQLIASIDLQPRVRLILSANERMALVLTTAGTLVEVTAP
jgi:hypothetical protein